MDRYDLVILGSGSTAFAAALRAEELGKTAVLTEERTVGGTCVNRGCLPSKNLIEAARLLHDAQNPRYPGLSPTKPEIDFRELVRQKDEVVRSYREKRYESLIGDRIRIERGHARFLDPHTVEVDGRKITGDRILIATGSRPVLPPTEGLADVPYLTSDLLTSDEPLELEELPESLLLVGGGYIALELGQMFRRFGSEVTIVERSGEILSRGYEPEVGPTIRTILEEEGIRVLTYATVRSVRRDGSQVAAVVETKTGAQEFHAARLLVAAGRRPNSDRIALEKAGVSLEGNGDVRVDRHLRTNVPYIFAAGDVIGSQTGSEKATPVGSHDGSIAAHNALSSEEPRAVDHRVVPRTIFTDPQVATVGMTEKEAIAAGHSCWCNTLPMSLVPRAGAIRDTRGIVKMVAEVKTDEVLGVSMVAPNAGEVIHEAAMALRFRARLQDFIDQLHVYPTMAEALKIVAISRFKDPAKLSCCAE
ncbi:MAG TPA: mercury(II) reductase [Thermoanaerobaculia bacterium]